MQARPSAGLDGPIAIRYVYGPYARSAPMGLVNIDDVLHDQLRRASGLSCRSINAQATYWMKIGMLAELNPGLTFNEILSREMQAAGVDPTAPLEWAGG